ncbi:MAG: ATP-dependent DNA helicase [Bryobacteraceae bacterium]
MPSKKPPPTMMQFFGREGLLSKWHDGYEYRPGQLQMAEAVAAALADRRHTIVEAGTGTGKTLAYLIPAILSGRRVVVSTGTKNLQEQLFFKDVPFLERHFGRDLKVCYMKGRANYACRQKIYDAEKEPVLEGMEEVIDFRIIEAWEKTTKSGDRAEIRTLPANSVAWAKVDARRDRCSGQDCPQFDRCFITLMQQRARESDIIIVNHHLFFADLAVKEAERGGVIPDYEAVIFDEAHEMEDIAGEYFGLSVSNYQFEELTRDVASLARRKSFGSQELDRILPVVDQIAANFFTLFDGFETGRRGFRDHADFRDRNDRVIEDVMRSLELLGAHLHLIKDPPDEMIPLQGRVTDLAASLTAFLRGDDAGLVYWVERRGRGVFLAATPIEVSALLEERLFDRIDTVVLVSATLAVAGGFEFVQKRLGVRTARTLLVPGHFDYGKQSLLYVPQHLPDPRNAGFADAAAREVTILLRITVGRAFVLFTSYQQMRLVYDRVSFSLDYPMLLQGAGPNNALLEEFRSTPNCVLFGTTSFWQGVDVPGDQLSCVIIDKLPFAVPSDPVVAARMQAIRDAGGEPFYEYQVPEAALMLKQGFGRLIRSGRDRGLLALLDNRITRQRYGQVFFDSLPGYGFTMNVRDVEGFFQPSACARQPARTTGG